MFVFCLHQLRAEQLAIFTVNETQHTLMNHIKLSTNTGASLATTVM